MQQNKTHKKALFFFIYSIYYNVDVGRRVRVKLTVIYSHSFYFYVGVAVDGVVEKSNVASSCLAI